MRKFIRNLALGCFSLSTQEAAFSQQAVGVSTHEKDVVGTNGQLRITPAPSSIPNSLSKKEFEAELKREKADRLEKEAKVLKSEADQLMREAKHERVLPPAIPGTSPDSALPIPGDRLPSGPKPNTTLPPRPPGPRNK
jgi:hypothetical protein